MPENLLSLDLLRDLGWGAELFAVVTITLVGRFIAMRFLNVMAKSFRKDKKYLGRYRCSMQRDVSALSWFILVMGLLWAVEVSDVYVGTELFSSRESCCIQAALLRGTANRFVIPCTIY